MCIIKAFKNTGIIYFGLFQLSQNPKNEDEQ